MKAIILAAGMGTRMGKYTKDLPKCMLNFNGNTLIERQIGTLRSAGIRDIIVVKGYMPEKINISGVKYYINEDYANTNMVETLMRAETEMNDDILVCYGDILYQKNVVEKVIEANVDIGVTVDTDYLDYWRARLDNWQDDVESMVIGKGGNIVEIGVPNCELEKAKVRYVGLLKFSKKGIEILKKIYHKNREKYFDSSEKFMNSKCFKKMYMTDMIQLIINSGQKVYPVKIQHGWLEFDANEDYEKEMEWLKNGAIKRFFNFGS